MTSPLSVFSPLRAALASSVVLLALAGCTRETDPVTPANPDAPQATPATGTPAAASTELKDVIETTDHYVVGISYPPGINQHPGLAKALGDYANAARGELMQAVQAFGNDKPVAPYELSLAFEQVVNTPQIIAIAADGSRYTGGAHGEPLIARFVWLPQQQTLLKADALVPQPAGWTAISDYVRQQLHTAVSVRVEEDDLEPADRAALVKNSARMIDEGTEPNAQNFSQFVPVLAADGRIAALRFVFPPYQVGPYADGTQSVDVPAAVLLPHVAPAYAGLFAR